jgi:hypothetical protein
MIDGLNQYNAASGTAEMSEDGKSARAEISDAYPDVTAGRQVRINGCVIEDEMTVTCGAGRGIDWIFHGCGEFFTDIPVANAENALMEGFKSPLPRENGYKHFTNITKAAAKGIFTGYWVYEGKRLDITLTFDKTAELFTADTPDNPITLTRKAIVVRTRAGEMKVSAKFQLGNAYKE